MQQAAPSVRVGGSIVFKETRERRWSRALMRIPIVDGPFEGGSIEAPRRTPEGLRLQLRSGELIAEYLLVLRPFEGVVASLSGSTEAATH